VTIYHWAPAAHPEVLSRILREIGVESVDELYRDIPEGARFQGDWDSLPIGEGRPLAEPEVAARLEERLSRVRVYRDPPPFLGGGAWLHYVPAPIPYIVQRGEILTSYTPYQAEASQGVLQALFEFQSMIADLYDMDVANSSLYDGASALGEAVLMALRVRRGRRRILAAETVNPQRLEVARAYAGPHGAVVETVPVDRETGEISLDALESRDWSDVAALVVETPSYPGIVDGNLAHAGETARKHGALYIVGADPIAAALYKPPGMLGADIAYGDGQPLGLGLNYGGPSLGILAVRWEGRLVRNMPGRIAGLTVDSEGRRAFALILQTREQHIRRARATSNITTNTALNAIAAAAYMALLGGHGLRRLALEIRARTRYAARRLAEAGLESPLLHGEVWRDIPVGAPVGFERLQDALAGRGLLVGPPLGRALPWMGEGAGIVAVTEMHTRDHIDRLAVEVERVLGGGGFDG